MKLQRSRCFWNLDNVKGPWWSGVSSARAGELREISPGATCSTSNISFATTYRPGSADLVILRAISAIQKGREFSVSTIHERTSRSRDAGKSFSDKCAVLVLTASGTDREEISFPNLRVVGGAINPPTLDRFSFSTPRYEFRAIGAVSHFDLQFKTQLGWE